MNPDRAAANTLIVTLIFIAIALSCLAWVSHAAWAAL